MRLLVYRDIRRTKALSDLRRSSANSYFLPTRRCGGVLSCCTVCGERATNESKRAAIQLSTSEALVQRAAAALRLRATERGDGEAEENRNAKIDRLAERCTYTGSRANSQFETSWYDRGSGVLLDL